VDAWGLYREVPAFFYTTAVLFFNIRDHADKNPTVKDVKKTKNHEDWANKFRY